MMWLDDNHIEGEMSDDDFLAKILEEARIRDMKRYGRDGTFVVYSERFTYRNIPYEIKINRYFQIGIQLDKIKGMNHLGKWAVLENTPETKPIREIIENLPYPIGDSEWMWGDTLHTWNDGMTLKQMVDAMHEQAREDIHLLDKLEIRLNDYIIELKEKISKVDALIIPFVSQFSIKGETEK